MLAPPAMVGARQAAHAACLAPTVVYFDKFVLDEPQQGRTDELMNMI